jgi:epoxyqueuosine reductase
MTSPSLVELMELSPEGWDEFTRGSPVRRARREGLLRNVAVALGNWDRKRRCPWLVEALSDSEALVRGHAAWALGEIGSLSAPTALADRLGVEDDPWVREELEFALDGLQTEVQFPRQVRCGAEGDVGRVPVSPGLAREPPPRP